MILLLYLIIFLRSVADFVLLAAAHEAKDEKKIRIRSVRFTA